MDYRKIGISIVGNLAAGVIMDRVEKRVVFDRARRKADELNLPLLNYGCRFFWYAIDRSDVNMDIVPRDVPNFRLVPPDSQNLPFKEKTTVIFCSHTLEHLVNPEFLLKEFDRISDYVYIVLPKVWSIPAWIHLDHKWIVIPRKEGFKFYRNPFYNLFVQ